MKTIMILSLLVSASAFASLNMKPGLWTVQTKVTQDGKTHEPRVEMKKSMEDMSPEQRSQVEAMMKKMGAGLGDDGMKVCYTPEMIQNDSALSRHGKEKCETHFKTKTASRVAGDFKCDDGSTGKMDWTLSGNEKYTGKVTLDRDGKKTDIAYNGKFVSSDCGDVKPIDMKAMK